MVFANICEHACEQCVYFSSTSSDQVMPAVCTFEITNGEQRALALRKISVVFAPSQSC